MMIGNVIAQTPDSRFSRQMEGIQFSPCMNTLSHPVLKKAESAANEKYVSYCEEAAPYLRMTPEIYDMATYFDRMLVDRYVGDKVTKIRVAIGAPVNGLTIWLREKLDEEPVFSMEVPQTSLEEKGWIEVELPADKVYTITENGYYVGYTITSKKYNNNDKTYYPIAIAGNGLLREKTLLYSDDGGKNWVDHTCTFINNGIVAVLGAQTAIVSEHHVDKDLALVNFKSNLAFIKRDPQKEKVRIDFSGYVFNGGTEPVTSFDLTVSAEGIETKTSEVTIKGGLKALKGVILQSYVEIPSNAESANVMLKISNINKGAFTDEYEKNNEGKVEVYFYDRDFVKTSLLEMYTTGYCPNCPYGHKVAEAIPESVNHVKVAHHGSRNNISNELLDIIDCDNFIFSTNGGIANANHPDREAIANILCHPQRNRNKKIHLYFNYLLNDIIESGAQFLNTETDNQEKYNFEIHESTQSLPNICQ